MRENRERSDFSDVGKEKNLALESVSWPDLSFS